MPPLLSQTGVFSNTPSMTPTNGLIPYNPNTPLWSDGAVKTRWMAVPYNGGADTSGQQIGFATNGEWSFPSGTVFVKHFALVTDETNPNAPLRRLETRLLVRDINGAVYGVTYKWRPDNSDADLLTTSLTENILITNATGVSTQTWYYPSPADCLQCHTPVANYVLGVKTRQLNGNLTYPSTGVTDNQLRVFNRLGIFNPAIDEAQIPTYAQMVSVTNLLADLTNRFRSYIDANCAQCHRPGGVSHADFDARYDTPLASQGIINGTVVTSLGIDNPRVVMPHDIWRSVLYQRADVRNSGIQMPPLASSLVDTNAMAVVVDFINSLAGTPALAPPVLTPSGGTNYGPVSITVQPPDTNATVYYTLDGTLPTTGSLVYSNAIVLTNTATVSANAFETGYINSVAASGLFTILPPILFSAPGAFSNGVFQLQLSATPNQSYVLQSSTNLMQWIPISTSTPSASPFYLTDPNATNFQTAFIASGFCNLEPTGFMHWAFRLMALTIAVAGWIVFSTSSVCGQINSTNPAALVSSISKDANPGTNQDSRYPRACTKSRTYPSRLRQWPATHLRPGDSDRARRTGRGQRLHRLVAPGIEPLLGGAEHRFHQPSGESRRRKNARHSLCWPGFSDRHSKTSRRQNLRLCDHRSLPRRAIHLPARAQRNQNHPQIFRQTGRRGSIEPRR